MSCCPICYKLPQEFHVVLGGSFQTLVPLFVGVTYYVHDKHERAEIRPRPLHPRPWPCHLFFGAVHDGAGEDRKSAHAQDVNVAEPDASQVLVLLMCEQENGSPAGVELTAPLLFLAVRYWCFTLSRFPKPRKNHARGSLTDQRQT